MDNKIVIVSGLPRSGTSMMMQILKAGGMPIVYDESRQPDESNPRGYYEDQRVNHLERDNSWLKSCAGQAVKITSHWLPFLPEGLPARIIFMMRDLDEIIASQNKMLREKRTSDPDKLKKIYHDHLLQTLSWLKRQSHLDYLICNYGELIVSADKILEKISLFLGGKFKIKPARSVIRPELHRNKKESLCENRSSFSKGDL